MRLATIDDMPEIIRMGAAFYQYNNPPWTWDSAGFSEFIGGLIVDDAGFVAISDGFIAGVKMPHIISREWLVATEFLWWSNANTGPSLMKSFREWAHDADEINYSCPYDAGKVQRFFSGFSTPKELVFSEVKKCV